MTFTPTDEQQAALDLFRAGGSMVIEAGAGTGKTSTLKLLAEDADVRNLRGRYLAFNKAIVTDVQGKLPKSCEASTAHAVAFRAVGKPYAHRLDAPRMASWTIANFLDLDPFVVSFGSQRKVLSAEYLAGLVMRTIGVFCQTADERPSYKHKPYIDGIDLPLPNGKRTYANNDAIGRYLEPAIARAWLDLQNVNGQLKFGHDHYLKLWHLSHPTASVDYILFDEAQDANPVMAAVIGEQEHVQRVYVGDSQQAIYEFTGAVNAMAGFQSDDRRLLTQSFRFGDAIADEANTILARLKAELRLKGAPLMVSSVGPADDEDVDAVLCRTNAAAVTTVMEAKQRGQAPHLVGGGTEVASFARGATALQRGERSFHPDLACFDSWGEVQDYVRQDAQGGELKLLVKLVDDFGTATILDALSAMPSERDADVIVSTAHKSKGREWPVVQLHADFAEFAKRLPTSIETGDPDEGKGEQRLLYVATTRAKEHLDNTALTEAGKL